MCVSKLADRRQRLLEAPFKIDIIPTCWGRDYSFLWIAPRTLDPYLIMLCVEQGGSKYNSLSLWYDSTWD